MSWIEPIQLLGYTGTLLNLLAMVLLVRSQHRTSFQWTLCIAGNLMWVTWGIIQKQPSVIADAIISTVVVSVGLYKFLQQKHTNKE